MELVSFGERNVVFLTGGEHHTHTYNVGALVQNSQAELEKAHLIIEAQQKEISYLKEIIELMKTNQK